MSTKSPWQEYTLSLDHTHHLINATPVYEKRFLRVMRFHPPGVAPVKDSSGAYHIDQKGEPLYPFRYLDSYGYYENRAAISTPDGWCHIDLLGNPLYPSRYAWCGNFQEGKSPVRDKEGCYFHVELEGDPLYPEKYSYVGDFKEGIAVVCLKEGKSTHIDEKGRFIHPFFYKELDLFHKGYARAQEEKGWLHIRPDGLPAYERRFAHIEPFYNGQAHVQTFEGDLLVIDEKGKTLHTIYTASPHSLSHLIGSLSSDFTHFWKTETVFLALKNRLFDHLPATVEELCSFIPFPPACIQKILRALWEAGFVYPLENKWHPTDKGKLLTPQKSAFMAACSQMWKEVQGEWARLEKSLSQYPPVAHDTFKEETQDPQSYTLYQKALQGYALEDFKEVFAWPLWKKNAQIYACGHTAITFLQELLQRYPSLKGTILNKDRPIHHFEEKEELTPRLKKVFQDPLTPWSLPFTTLPDIVVLPRFLHYFPDREALEIIQQAYISLKKGGFLYIFEMVLEESSPQGALLDLHMLVESGGTLRTQAEWERLLAKTPFLITSFQCIKPHLHLITAKKEAHHE